MILYLRMYKGRYPHVILGLILLFLVIGICTILYTII
jgi:hypothetical protein